MQQFSVSRFINSHLIEVLVRYGEVSPARVKGNIGNQAGCSVVLNDLSNAIHWKSP